MLAAEKTMAAKKLVSWSLLFPFLCTILLVTYPDCLHVRQTWFCTTSGCAAWTILGVCGLTAVLEPQSAAILITEFVFGLVPLIYMLFDWRRAGPTCGEQVYQHGLVRTIPLVIVTKQLIRWTIIDMFADDSAITTWWHASVDFFQIFAYFVFGILIAADMGEVWFVIYSAVPAAWSLLVVNRIVRRMRELFRSNSRLMLTAFSAVVRIDARDCGKVTESSAAFDALVYGSAKDQSLGDLFTASSEQLKQLFATVDIGVKIVRRLRTTLISKAGAFQQDVELRVLAESDSPDRPRGASGDRMLSLGVSIMGERVPVIEGKQASPSLLVEQCLDEVGQLWAVGTTADQARLPELAHVCLQDFENSEIGPRDSISCGGLRHRHRKDKDRSSRKGSRCSLSVTSSTNDAAQESSDCQKRGSRTSNSPRTSTRPYGEELKPTKECEDYLIECSFGLLEDIITAWNFTQSSCCFWHSATDRLSIMVGQMRHWHECSDGWPKKRPAGFCESCSAVRFQDDTSSATSCLLCFTPLDGEES